MFRCLMKGCRIIFFHFHCWWTSHTMYLANISINTTTTTITRVWLQSIVIEVLVVKPIQPTVCVDCFFTILKEFREFQLRIVIIGKNRLRFSTPGLSLFIFLKIAWEHEKIFNFGSKKYEIKKKKKKIKKKVNKVNKYY